MNILSHRLPCCNAGKPQLHGRQRQRCRAAGGAGAATGAAPAEGEPRAFGEDQYFRTRQSHQREAWAESIRAAGAQGRRRPDPSGASPPPLDPPAALAGVSVILVEPLRPRTVGTVARLCACFEALDLRLVAPRCDHLSRPALSTSKGAQYVLRGAALHATLEGALAAAGAQGVAFTRWVEDGGGGGGQRRVDGVAGLLADPAVAAALGGGGGGSSGERAGGGASGCSGSSDLDGGGGGGGEGDGVGGGRVALVFGREEFGLSDEEVAACAVACALPMGRLSESLSLSHAAAIALEALFSAAAEGSGPRG